MLIVGIVAGKVFLPIRTEQILKKRKNMLTRQFRDMLDGLTTSLGAGNNIMDSLYAVREDLQWKAKNLVKDFFYNEEGDVNIVSMVVLIGIAVLLAVIFKNNIKDLLDVLFKAISGNAEKAVS